MSHLGRLVHLRTAALLAVTLAVEWGAGRALWGRAHRPARDFTTLLELGAHGALVLAGGWLALILAAVLITTRRGQPPSLPCPRSWRRPVLALCGVGLSLAAVTPSYATQRPAPPPLPSLAVPITAAAPIAAAVPATVTVAPGDSLWSIARARHPHANAAQLRTAVESLYAANRERIGPDPDLIRPGQRLRFPAAAPGSRR